MHQFNENILFIRPNIKKIYSQTSKKSKKFIAKHHSLPNHLSPDEKDTDFEMCFVKILYVGIHSKWFANRLSELIKRQFEIKLRVLFDTLK